MGKIDNWITKIPRLKNSKVARFSYKADAYANNDIEGVDSYDYSNDMNVPLATHTDFDGSVLSTGARANFSSIPKNGLNHFFGRVSYNLNKVIDFLADLIDDFRIQGVETVASSVSKTLASYYSGKKLRLANTHATNSITFTFYTGQTYQGSNTVSIPAGRSIDIELIGTTWRDSLTGNLIGNADTATLATQANEIKPLGNSITLSATQTSETKIIKIATVNWFYSGAINITCTGTNIEDTIKVDIKGAVTEGLKIIYGNRVASYGIKKIIVTLATPDWNSTKQIYAEIKTYPNYAATTALGVVETIRGIFIPSMTEVSSVEGTVLDSLALDYRKGEISSFQHVFTKNIIGNLTGNADTASTASKANVRVSLRHGDAWFAKTWAGLTDFVGERVWTDGDNIYYSYTTEQYVLSKATSIWAAKTWAGLTNFNGSSIWTDGENIYYSNETTHYVLNKETSTWVAKTWNGLTNFVGYYIWTDGVSIYYSDGTSQYVLNKETSTWVAKTWNGLTNFVGSGVWTDGENIYYSYGTSQYVLNKETSTWAVKTWTGLTDFVGWRVWTDGENIYYSYGTTHRVLNKATATWVAKTWSRLIDFTGVYNWTDGDNIYNSNGENNYVLSATRHNYVDDNKYNSLFGIITTCSCSTLSARFVFRNE